MGAKVSSGSPQADGSTKNEPTFDVKHVASSIVYMASLPLGANVLSHTMYVSSFRLIDDSMLVTNPGPD